MKKIVATISVFLLILTACGDSSALPTSLEEMSPENFEAVYENALEGDAIVEMRADEITDDSQLSISRGDENTIVYYWEIDDDKEYVQYFSYYIKEDDEIKNVFYTDKYPNKQSGAFTDDEFDEAEENLEYTQDESDIPDEYMFNNEDVTKLLGESLYNVTSDIGKLNSVESDSNSEDRVLTRLEFENGNGNLTLEEDETEISLNDANRANRVSFTFDNRKVSEEIKEIFTTEYEENLE